ncbi:MAG: hypothetical protein QOD09_139 [Bradyrhizobium sp.]|jgi:hypothetical protein|nr:hypothetical protein [Bradyrhizobium sp.]
MSRELFLARRLIEAAADPYAPVSESENAASELAAFARRFGASEKRGYPVDVEQFEGMRPDDLSVVAWLLLLENAEQDDPIVPDGILEQLFQTVEDEIIRLRLVSAVLGHPRIRQAYQSAMEFDPTPTDLAKLPDCWPKLRLLQLDQLRRSEKMLDDATPAERLQEFVLYLLQDGSLAARALAAAAVAPTEEWRSSARQLVENVVRQVDPNLRGYGAPFARVLGGERRT